MKGEDTVEAKRSQPVLVVSPLLALLLMLRSRPPRRRHTRWHEFRLPRGCVLAVRYGSR
jgi:hypothetical protein